MTGYYWCEQCGEAVSGPRCHAGQHEVSFINTQLDRPKPRRKAKTKATSTHQIIPPPISAPTSAAPNTPGGTMAATQLLAKRSPVFTPEERLRRGARLFKAMREAVYDATPWPNT